MAVRVSPREVKINFRFVALVPYKHQSIDSGISQIRPAPQTGFYFVVEPMYSQAKVCLLYIPYGNVSVVK